MIAVEQLTNYSADDARDLGALRPYLDDGAPDTPVDETKLRHIIESNTYTQLVARDETGNIIGAATLTYIESALTPAKCWLEDFVTHVDYRGRGVSDQLWSAMEDWCHEHDISLNFTSRASRERAHTFYHEHGAHVRETTVFHKDID